MRRPGLGGKRAFALLAATQTLSILGSRMSGVAAGFAVYAETDRAAPLLLFSFCNELPAMLFGTLAGAVTDRRGAKTVAMIADAVQALGSAVLALAFLSGRFETWMLYAVGFLQGSAAAFQGPAKDLLTARLVPDEGRDRANAILSMTHPAAGILAPMLSGALYPLIGVAGIVAIDLLTFLAALGSLALTAIPSGREGGHAETREGFIEGLRASFSYLSGKKGLLLLIIYASLLNFLLNGPLELSLPYALARTGSEKSAGFILSLQGFGGLAGSALLALRGRVKSRRASLLLGMSGAGLLMMGISVSRSALALGLSLFGVIACLQTWSRLTSIYQAEIPPERQGTLMAFSGQLGFLGSTLSFALFGFLADRVFAPLASSPSWTAGEGVAGILAWIFGAGSGAGMGMLIGGAGLLILALTLGMGLSGRMAEGRGSGSEH